MEETKAINCPKENCNGVLVEGVRGFHKCTVCGAKVKNSLVAQLSGEGVTVAKKGDSKKAESPKTKPAEQPKTTKSSADVQSSTDNSAKDTTAANKQATAPKTPKQPTQKVTTTDGITLVGKTAIIKCIDCGAERIVKVQDVFQVKRCVNCQKDYTKRRRAEKLKANRAAK